MTGFYDMHCHLLPGVDDGSKSMEETMAALKREYQQGIRTVVCTPHYMEDSDMHAPRAKIASLIESVRAEAEKAGLEGLTLIQGNELYWPGGIIEALEGGTASTYGESRFVLTEFQVQTSYRVIGEAVRAFFQNGYTPVLAHAERYDCLYRQEDRIAELRRMGVWIQMNTENFKQLFPDARTKWWRKQCQEGKVHLIGTDSHGIDFRPPEYTCAVNWIKKHCTEGLAQKILNDNPEMILNVKKNQS